MAAYSRGFQKDRDRSSVTLMGRSDAQRRADARYEEKRKGTRHRGWVWVSYPESVDEHWRDMLTNEGVPMFISPLHDRDVNADGTLKKEHNHGLMLWDSPTSYEVARAIADAIGAVMPPKNPKPGTPKPYAANVRSAARYLCHLDNPDKAQYDPEQVTCINCTLADYYELISSAGDDDLILDAITDYIDENEVVSFAAFVRYCKQERPEWKRLAYHKYAPFITRYIKSCEWESRPSGDDVRSIRERAEREAQDGAMRVIESVVSDLLADKSGKEA